MATKNVKSVSTVAAVLATNQMVVKCRTRLNETDKTKVLSNLTITFDDENATREFAKRGIVIAWQSLCRVAGVIPENDTVSVADLVKRSGGGGFKVTPESLGNRINKMSAEDYAATLTALKLDVATVKKMVAQKYPK